MPSALRVLLCSLELPFFRTIRFCRQGDTNKALLLPRQTRISLLVTPLGLLTMHSCLLSRLLFFHASQVNLALALNLLAGLVMVNCAMFWISFIKVKLLIYERSVKRAYAKSRKPLGPCSFILQGVQGVACDSKPAVRPLNAS